MCQNPYLPLNNPLTIDFWQKMNLKEGDPGHSDLEDDYLFKTLYQLYCLGATKYLSGEVTELTAQEREAFENIFKNGVAHGIECRS